MKIQNVHVIVNLANNTDESILADLESGFTDSTMKYAYTVVGKEDDIFSIVQNILGTADLVAVYGGDGTAVRVAQALIGQETPLAIFPGGTANVLAKELGIPLDFHHALALIKNPASEIKKIDTGLCNDKPFIIRINFGIMADMVSHAERSLKDSFGQLAYGISALETMADVKPMIYKMIIDGVAVKEKGVSLTVTNAGNIGVSGFSFLPDIYINDGLFDVILLDHADILSILRVAGSTLMHTESSVLKRWKTSDFFIEFKKQQSFICDDTEIKSKQIHVRVVPKSLNVLVPATSL